jgi:hypothetical protein
MLKKHIICEILNHKKLMIALMDQLEIIEVGYLRALLRRNDPRFTQLETLRLIAAWLRVEVSDLVAEPKPAAP